MVRLPKEELLATVERAILDGGWNFLRLSPSAEHPASYSIFRGDRGESSCIVRIYIWNLTPGGQNRPPDEWRIQATGVGRFDAEPNGKTLILGWENERGVFVGFDLHKHAGPIGFRQARTTRDRLSQSGAGRLRPELRQRGWAHLAQRTA